MLDAGTDAPSFELPNQAGEVVSLEAHRGSRVVLYFYPRADTSGCTTEACSFRDHWDEFEDRNIVVLGVSDDPVADLESFRDKYGLPFNLLSDESGAVAAAYESYGEKSMFGNTFMGVFRNTYVISPAGKIESRFEKVTPDGHGKEILAAIDLTPP